MSPQGNRRRSSGEPGPNATNAKKDCHERALGLLAVRQRSRLELERRLLQAGFAADEVAEELERLERVGLIDDEAFARALAEHAAGRRKEGHRVVAARLATAGVAVETAGAVLETLVDEEGRADALARERAGRVRGLPPEKAFGRLAGFLMRRGYAPEVARRAAARALAVEATED